MNYTYNVQDLKEKISAMTSELDEIIAQGETPADHSASLQKKYKIIHQTSNTLFNYIINEYSKNKKFFNNTIDMMLSQLQRIQSSEMSQHDASVVVGEHLAETFIPQLKKN